MKINGKRFLITGGTGSFGNAVLSRLLNEGVEEVRILSRDEKKQDDMRKLFADSRIKFYLGDVRDYGSILSAVEGVHNIFHAAALKQVPSCEFFPMEAMKTNVVGTENVINAALTNGVDRVVVLSTDKAVYPINAMGITKALMEKVALAKARGNNKTIINITRYGNVMCSRGSVIPLFVSQIQSGSKLTLTDPKMTRFMMSLEEAVELVLHAFLNGKNGEIYVQKAPAATIETLALSLMDLFEVRRKEFDIIGTRHGEKLYEVLLSREEMALADDLGQYFRVPPDTRDLNYQNYIDHGKTSVSNSEDFNSHNARRLSRASLLPVLSKLSFIKDALGDPGNVKGKLYGTE